MKDLYDFDIYYNGERLDNIIYIDDEYMNYGDTVFIKIKYIKDTKLITIIDNVKKFSFVERGV